MTVIDEEELIRRLLEEDEEFRQLREEHKWFHRKVEELDKRPYLTPAERVTRDELKKKKLAVKDRMEEIKTLYLKRLKGGA